MTYPDFEDLSPGPVLPGDHFLYQFMPAVISGNAEPQRYWGSLVTANYFDVVRPAFVIGHGFDAARDDIPGEQPVGMLSHRLWRSRFASDQGIVGRTIELNGREVR